MTPTLIFFQSFALCLMLSCFSFFCCRSYNQAIERKTPRIWRENGSQCPGEWIDGALTAFWHCCSRALVLMNVCDKMSFMTLGGEWGGRRRWGTKEHRKMDVVVKPRVMGRPLAPPPPPPLCTTHHCCRSSAVSRGMPNIILSSSFGMVLTEIFCQDQWSTS